MDDLNRRIAEALGKHVVMMAAEDDLWIEEVSEDGLIVHSPVPDYAHDLNALTAEIERAGYKWDCGSSGHTRYNAYLWMYIGDTSETHAFGLVWGDTAAAALGEAFLMVLEAREGAGE